MKITFHLFVCFLVFATISDVDQAESVGVRTECENTNIAQRSAINSFNQVDVHKSAEDHQHHHEHPKQIAEEIIRKIHKEAFKRTKLATKLSKFRARDLTELALNSNKKIVTLMKLPDDEIQSITEKAFAVEKMTRKSADLILELVRKTVTYIRRSLREAARSINVLSKSYIVKFQAFSHTNMEEIISAIEKCDDKKALILFTNSLAKIKVIAAESGRCLKDTYNNAKKIVIDIAKCGGDLVNDTAHKQIQKLEPFHANYTHLENYIDYVSRGIIKLSQLSAKTYMDLVKDCLRKLKGVVDSNVLKLEKFGIMLYTMGETYIKTHSVSKEIDIKITETVETFHKSSDEGLVKLFKYVTTKSKNYLSAIENAVRAYKGCSVGEKCVVTKK